VGPTAGLDGYGKSRPPPPPSGIRSPDLLARSESLYRLRYPGPTNVSMKFNCVTCICRYKRMIMETMQGMNQDTKQGRLLFSNNVDFFCNDTST
jgi:hypothetical protein